VQRLTGGAGVQAVIVLTAANAAYTSAVPMLKFGGRVVCVGLPEGAMVPIGSAWPQVLIARSQSIVGVAVGTRRDAIEVLDFARRGVVKVHSRVEKMDKLTEVSLFCALPLFLGAAVVRVLMLRFVGLSGDARWQTARPRGY
jgi:alcohol dehydrogenase, propanol-preferring